MTITAENSEASAHVVALRWTTPDENLWVAQGDGDFAGMVEFSAGHFVSTDRAGRLIDSFSSLPDARAAVDASAQ